jgi:hypothetical protein
MFCRSARIRSAVSKSRLATGRNVVSCSPRSTVYGEPLMKKSSLRESDVTARG